MKKLTILSLILLIGMSCKKDEIKPQIETVTHYHLTSARQFDEANDLYVYTNRTTRVQTLSMITTADEVVRLPFRITGDYGTFPDLNIELTGYVFSNSDGTLSLYYDEWDLFSKVIKWRINGARYVKVP